MSKERLSPTELLAQLKLTKKAKANPAPVEAQPEALDSATGAAVDAPDAPDAEAEADVDGEAAAVAVAEPLLSTDDLSEVFDRVNSLLGDSCLLYTSPSPRDATLSRMPSSA